MSIEAASRQRRFQRRQRILKSLPKIFIAVSLALIAFFQATGIGGVVLLWIAFALSVVSGAYTIFDEWPEKSASEKLLGHMRTQQRKTRQEAR